MNLKGLYVITDEILTPHATIVEQVHRALEAGANVIQYRNKSASDEEAEPYCRKLLALCRTRNVPFILNDRAALAQRIGADGLHIGKDDTPLEEAGALFDRGVIGVSCYGSIERAEMMQSRGADYVAFGSFFPSPTKPKAPVVPLDLLNAARETLDVPFCAIGGIDANNIARVAARKPDMICVIRAAFADDAIETNMQRLRSFL